MKTGLMSHARPDQAVEPKSWKEVRMLSCENHGMAQTYIDRADKVRVAAEQISHSEAEDDCKDPSAEETLDSLFGADLDELGAAKSDAADVGKDVVCNDQRGGQEEPDHALENVVHDKVGLDDNQVQGHVGPCKLGKLKLVVALLERHDKEDKA